MPLTRAAKQTTSNIPSVTGGAGAHGLKRKADGRTILGDATNSKILQTKKGGLGNSVLAKRNINSGKNSREILKVTPKRDVALKNFSGHDGFTTVPLDVWRIELRDQLLKQNTFYDQEQINKENHIESPDFALGIFEYMKWREERFEVQPYFNKTDSSFLQKGFNEMDRRTLVDWMVEFQEIQETTHETLYLAVRLCDYYFSKRTVSRDKLQLYAFVGFLLASKFEERWPPTFEDMIYLSEDAYRRDDFVNAELDMLKVLDFDINIPISYRYLRRYAKVIGMDMKSLTVARFYLELTLQEYQYVSESQSKLAAAALWIALSTLGYDINTRKKCTTGVRYNKKYWTDLLSYYTGFHEWEIVDLARRMADTAREVQAQCKDLDPEDIDDDVDDKTCKIIFNKYVSSTFFEVAKLRIPEDTHISQHHRRCESERIDFESTQEPQIKRRSSGCSSRLRKMTLRSSTTPNQPPNPNQLLEE